MNIKREGCLQKPSGKVLMVYDDLKRINSFAILSNSDFFFLLLCFWKSVTLFNTVLENSLRDEWNGFEWMNVIVGIIMGPPKIFF